MERAQVFVVRAGLHAGAREMLGRDELAHGAGAADFLRDLDAIDVAVEVIGFGEGIGVDDRRIGRIGRAQPDVAARTRPHMVGIAGGAIAAGHGAHTFLHTRAGEEVELQIGRASDRSLHQKAPASTMLEATGPVRNMAYCRPAQSFQWAFLYLS